MQWDVSLLVAASLLVTAAAAGLEDDWNSRAQQCLDVSCGAVFEPHSPLVNCSYLPLEFLECEEPKDLYGNKTEQIELGYGCVKFGGQRYEDVEQTAVYCKVLPDIECFGKRRFLRHGVPCIRYTNHYFLTTLLYSVLLGFLGVDRFCLGQTGTAVGKLLTLEVQGSTPAGVRVCRRLYARARVCLVNGTYSCVVPRDHCRARHSALLGWVPDQFLCNDTGPAVYQPGCVWFATRKSPLYCSVPSEYALIKCSNMLGLTNMHHHVMAWVTHPEMSYVVEIFRSSIFHHELLYRLQVPPICCIVLLHPAIVLSV